MNKIALLATLLVLPGLAGAVTPVSVERAPGAPAVDPATEQTTCTTSPSPIAGRPAETVCLTAGQRAAQAADAAIVAQRAKAAEAARPGVIPDNATGRRR